MEPALNKIAGQLRDLLLQRHKGVLLGAAALVTGPVALSNLQWIQMRSAAVASELRDVAGMMGARSPGERQTGQLIKSKAQAASAKPANNDAPRQRALGKTFALPSPDDLPGLLAGPLLADAPLVLGAEGPVGGDLGAIGLPSAALGSGPGALALVPIGGGGGGSGGDTPGPIPTEQAPNPTIAAVPEPSTWFTMILGFGYCGYLLRRTRSRRSTVGRPRRAAS